MKYLGGFVAMAALVLGGVRCSAGGSVPVASTPAATAQPAAPGAPARPATPGATATPAATVQPATAAVSTRSTPSTVPTPTATTARPPTAAATPAPPAPPYARISGAGGRLLIVRIEVADTDQSRATGLSRRPSMPEDAGMVFVFPFDQQAAFWMKDTLIPLSIAFISSGGQILEIQDMEAMSEDLHRPARPYRYALEVNQGFFKRSGIVAGDRVEFQLGGGR